MLYYNYIINSLESYDINIYKQLFLKSNTIIFDEIQLISNPGRTIKIMYDAISDLKIIVTGSTGFNIKNKSGESLAGRSIEYALFPLTF